MASETTTPNIGLQVPAFNQANWQVPLNYDLNLIDLIFGGSVQVPALWVVNLVLTNIGAMLAAGYVAETPAGALPGTVYTLSKTPGLITGVYVNGIFQRPGIDYTAVGAVITLSFATSSTDTVYATYFQ